MADKLRVRIFIDFWNFQLRWNDACKNGPISSQIPWRDLPGILVAEAAKGQPAKFSGAHVYASVNAPRTGA